MSTIIDVKHSSITATVLGGVLSVPLPQIRSEVEEQIAIPDFNCGLITTLTNFTPVIDSTKVIAEAVLDDYVNMTLTFTGKLAEGETLFRVEETSLQIRLAKELARIFFRVFLGVIVTSTGVTCSLQRQH